MRAGAQASSPTISRKRSPRRSKFSKASKLAQAGESRTTSPGRAARGGGADGVLEVGAAVERRPPSTTPRELGREPVGGGADQVAGGASARSIGSTSGANGSPLSLPPRIAWTPPSKARRPTTRRGDVGRLRVVDEADAVDLGDLLEPVRDAGEAPQALADRVPVDAHRQRRGGGRHRVGGVVLAEQAQLLGPQQRLAVVEDRPLGERHLAIGAGAAAEGDPPAAAAEVGPGKRRVVGVVDRDVVVALVGEDPQLRREVGVEVGMAVEVVGGEVEEDAALGREVRRCPRAGSSRPRRRPSRPDPPRRRARRAACRRCRRPRPARRRCGRRARAARPWSSCRWSRSPRGTGSGSPSRPARARRGPRRPRSRAAAITGASAGTPGLFTTVRTPSSLPIPSVSRTTSTPSLAKPCRAVGIAQNRPR